MPIIEEETNMGFQNHFYYKVFITEGENIAINHYHKYIQIIREYFYSDTTVLFL